MILTQTIAKLNQTFLEQNPETDSTNSRLNSQNGKKALENVLGGYKTEELEEIPLAQISCDWLTKIYEFENYDQFKDKTEYLFSYMDDEVDFSQFRMGKIGRYFGAIFSSVRGAQIGINILEGGKIDCSYKLTGSVLGGADPKKLAQALLHLFPWFKNCTRFDTAYDRKDDVLLDVRSKAYECWEKGLNSGFRELDQHIEGKNPKYRLQTDDWGTNSSDRKVRIYDKPEIGAIRMEVQTRRERANYTYKSFVLELANSATWLQALENSFSIGIEGIEFYDTVKSVNLARNTVCNWWIEFKELVNYNNLELPKIQITKSLSKSIAWIRKSVAPAISAIMELYGSHFPDFLEQIRKEGKDRMNPKHKQELERNKREGNQFMREWNETEVCFA
jgi:hypothetical protein